MNEVVRRRKRSFHAKPTLWASQASAKPEESGEMLGKCLRAAFYEKTGVEVTNPVSAGVSMMGYMGIEIEDGLIELIKRMGSWENNNIKWVYNGVSGEVDIIINVPRGETWKNTGIAFDIGQVIVEAKSCSGYYANKEVFGTWSGRGDKKVYTPGRPKIKHLMQSALYADMSRGQMDGCIVAYVSRDESKMAEFLVQVNEDGIIFIDGVQELRFNIADVYRRYGELQGKIDSNTLPDCDYKHTYTDAEVEELFRRKGISATAKNNHLNGKAAYLDSDCKYCNYYDRCKLDGLGEKPNYSNNAAPAPTPIVEDDLFGDVTVQPTKESEKPGYMMHGSF